MLPPAFCMKSLSKSIKSTRALFFISVLILILSGLTILLDFSFAEKNKNKVRVWYPLDSSKCDGDFRFKFPYQIDAEPSAILIREATVDWRHVSINDVRDRGITGPYRRVLMLLTVLPDTKNNNLTEIEKPTEDRDFDRKAQLMYKNGDAVENVNVSFDYLIEDGRCQRDCGKNGPCIMKEWQSIITLTPKNYEDEEYFSALLNTLSRSGAYFNLIIPVMVRSRKKAQLVRFKIGLACVSSLSITAQIPTQNYMPTRTEKCRDSTSSVMLAGAPIFGIYSKDKTDWKQIAQFAARHMLGNTWFNSVIVSVHPKHTVSYIRKECAGKHSKCAEKYFRANYEHLDSIGKIVESELKNLKVPEAYWNHLVIVSFCNLGSDFEASEKNYPCSGSHQGGQKVWTHYAYTTFGPYYKWAASLDLDEILVDELAFKKAAISSPQRYQSAEEKFNLLQAETKKTSFMRAGWIFMFRSRQSQNSQIKL